MWRGVVKGTWFGESDATLTWMHLSMDSCLDEIADVVRESLQGKWHVITKVDVFKWDYPIGDGKECMATVKYIDNGGMDRSVCTAKGPLWDVECEAEKIVKTLPECIVSVVFEIVE